MPYSPFTRFLACVLVVLVALGLLWPDDRALAWTWGGTGAMAVLIAIFTWSAVKNSPPLDDRAFQHCLPAGPNRAFFRVIWIHLLVLAGIALAVLVYCWIWNFGWRAMSWGVVMLTVPAWALMSAMGVASSAGSSRQHWKSTAWVAVFLPPIVSAVGLRWLNEEVEAYTPDAVYFTPLRTMVLTAATLYPLIWWLIAARKRRGLGLLLGGATGALLPWLVVYGDFVKDSKVGLPDDFIAPSAAAQRLTLSRKPFAGSDKPLIPVEDLIDLQGLAEGEYTRVRMVVRSRENDFYGELPTSEVVVDESDSRAAGISSYPGTAIALKQGGKILWGNEAANRSIRNLLPPVETFEHLNWKAVLDRSDARLMVSNAPWAHSKPWSVSVMNPGSWKLLGSCLATEETSFRLEGGRTVKVTPQVQSSEGKDAIMIRCYFESLWQAQGPWFGDAAASDNWSKYDLAFVAIDETGKHAYLIDDFDERKDHGKVMLGEYERMFFAADNHDFSLGWQQVEVLRKSRLYVLVSEVRGYSRTVELPGDK